MLYVQKDSLSIAPAFPADGVEHTPGLRATLSPSLCEAVRFFYVLVPSHRT